MNIDKIEIVSEFKHLQIRFVKTLFDETGNPVQSTFERTTLICGDFERATAIGGEILALANLYWTEELVQKYNDSLPKIEEPASE